jgi:hypothetical protein
MDRPPPPPLCWRRQDTREENQMDHVAAPLLLAEVAVVVRVAFPVAASTVVFAWHAFRGTDPGPAGTSLLAVVRLSLRPVRPVPPDTRPDAVPDHCACGDLRCGGRGNGIAGRRSDGDDGRRSR